LTGERAKSNNQTTWTDFETAVELSIQRQYDGVGFMFVPPYVGVDMDDCIDQAGTLSPLALGILDRLNTYSEKSQSGHGVHAIFKGHVPELLNKGRKNKTIEIYARGRFFAMTGDVLPKYSKIIEDRTEAIKKILDDQHQIDDVLNRISKSKSQHAEKFKRLFNGEWKKYPEYPSQSEADEALCSILAFWTDKNHSLMDEIFRRSRLFRPKWDSTRGDSTYGQDTIIEAISNCTATIRSDQSKERWDGTKDKPRPTYNNIRNILDSDHELKNIFRLNLFKTSTDITKMPPWGIYSPLPKSIEKDDLISVKEYLRKHNIEPPLSIIEEAISETARQSPYHPVLDYLK
jgi:putative DNA primase/helicase